MGSDGASGVYPRLAIVLAGGLGARLRSALPGRPKVLAPVDGKPFLGYVLAYLTSQGIRDVILCLGYLADQVKAYAGSGKAWNLNIRYSTETTPLGTGGALSLAAGSMDHPFFALNGDTLFLADLQVLWSTHQVTNALATIALLEVTERRARGCVTLDESGKIVAFKEKSAQGGQGLVNSGVYILAPQALSTIKPGEAISLERRVFPYLASLGKLAGKVQRAYFADIGTPESLASFEKDVIAGKIQLNDQPHEDLPR
jgi:NDP-sugar pyrophosphorylase family protein